MTAACLAALVGCGGPTATSPIVNTINVPPAPPPAIEPTKTDDALSKAAAEYEAKLKAAKTGAVAAKPKSTLPPPEVQWVNTAPNNKPNKPTEATANPSAATSVPAEQPKKAAKPEPPKPADPSTLTTDEIIAALRQKMLTAKPSVKSAMGAAIVGVLDPKREITDKDLGSLSTEDRQLVLAFQRAFTQIGQALDAGSTDQRQQIQLAAIELAEQFNSPRKMRIKNSALCTRVNGFGQYQTFDSSSFLAGKEHPVIVYAELENFSTKVDTADQQHTVKLTQQIVLYNDADGLEVWKVKPSEIIDKSRNARRDFFVVQIVNLPARLSVGKYQLKLTVTDEQGQAVDEATLPIQIVADSKIAGK
jgi:hypothetical protein